MQLGKLYIEINKVRLVNKENFGCRILLRTTVCMDIYGNYFTTIHRVYYRIPYTVSFYKLFSFLCRQAAFLLLMTQNYVTYGDIHPPAQIVLVQSTFLSPLRKGGSFLWKGSREKADFLLVIEPEFYKEV